MEEKIVTLNFRKLLVKKIRRKRAKYLLSILRREIKKIAKTENVKISKEVNELIWKKGIQKPPSKIRIKILKEKDFAKVEKV